MLRAPALPFALAAIFASGMIAGQQMPASALSSLPAAYLLVATGAFVFAGQKVPHRLILPFLAVAFFLAGLSNAHPPGRPRDPHHIANQVTDGKEYTVVGRIAGLPARFTDRLRLIIDSQRLIDQQEERPVLGLVAVSVPAALPRPPEPGSLVAVRCRLFLRSASRNPGINDPLARRNIWVSGHTPSNAFLAALAPPTGLAGAIDRFRFLAGQRLEAVLPATQAALYRALLLGDRSRLPPATRTAFQRAGLVHLLAISGLHIGLLGLFAYATALFLFRRSFHLLIWCNAPKAATLAALPVMAAYALVAGMQPPVLRALIMAAGLTAALIVERRWSLLHGALGAATVIAIVDPAALHSASFQLSFGAIAGIGLWHRLLANRLSPSLPKRSPFRQQIAPALAATVAATLGTAPLLIYHFNRLPLYSVPATLMAAPLVGFWALPLGLAGLPFLFLSPDVGAFLLHLGSAGLLMTGRVAHWFASLPAAEISLPTPPALAILAAYGLLAGVRYGQSPWGRRLAGASALCIAATLLAGALGRYARELPRATVLDVGHGSAVLIELPRNVNVLVDGGGFRSPTYDVGQRIIAPVLWKRGISRLDAVVITHPHADHYNGLPFILARFRPQRLFVSRLAGPPTYRALIRQAQSLGIEVRTVGPGAKLYAKDDVRLTVLAGGTGKGSANEDSLVLACTAAGHSLLLPGDIGQASERRLAQRGIRAEALLLSHHGRQRNPAFLAAVAPRFVVVSTSRRLPLRPHEYTTSRCGALTLTWRSDGIAVRSQTARGVRPR